MSNIGVARSSINLVSPLTLSSPINIGGPQLERDQKHFPFSRSTMDLKEVERNNKDLVVPSNRTDDPFKDFPATTDVLSCKTKVNELEVQIEYLKDIGMFYLVLKLLIKIK